MVNTLIIRGMLILIVVAVILFSLPNAFLGVTFGATVQTTVDKTEN